MSSDVHTSHHSYRLATVTGWLVFALLAVATTAPAQQYRAAIGGRVTDSQGAALPGATVVATNVETNVASTTVTNEQGAYNIPQLTPGEYRLSVELPSFKRFVREGILLETADKASIHVSARARRY